MKRAIALLLLVTMSTGCTTTRVSQRLDGAPPAPGPDGQTSIVGVVLTDGERVEFAAPATLAADGTVRGRQVLLRSKRGTETRRIELRANQIGEYVYEERVRKTDTAKTLLTLGFVGGIIAYMATHFTLGFDVGGLGAIARD